MTNEKQLREFTNTFIHFNRQGKMFGEAFGAREQQIIKDLFELRKLETQLSAIYLRQTNGYSNDSGQYDKKKEARDQKRERKITALVEDIIAPYGFNVRFNGDPRGGAIRILLPDGRSNNMGGEDWGIYW